jgi:hypothetical protein
VDNWRWAGVPIYLRTGKRLARKVTEIAVTLKPVPHLAFQQEGSLGVHRTNTSVAAFSARARAGATVSMPIAWSDLTSKQPVFSVPSMQRALRRADSWRDYWTTKQRISRRAFAAVTRFR